MTDFPIGSKEYYREAIRIVVEESVPVWGFIPANGPNTGRVINRYDQCGHGTILRHVCDDCVTNFLEKIMAETSTIKVLFESSVNVGDPIPEVKDAAD